MIKLDKAKKILLGLVLFEISPFFLGTLFIGLVITQEGFKGLNNIMDANKILMMQILFALVAIIFWGLVGVHRYFEITNAEKTKK